MSGLAVQAKSWTSAPGGNGGSRCRRVVDVRSISRPGGADTTKRCGHGHAHVVDAVVRVELGRRRGTGGSSSRRLEHAELGKPVREEVSSRRGSRCARSPRDLGAPAHRRRTVSPGRPARAASRPSRCGPRGCRRPERRSASRSRSSSGVVVPSEQSRTESTSIQLQSSSGLVRPRSLVAPRRRSSSIQVLRLLRQAFQ